MAKRIKNPIVITIKKDDNETTCMMEYGLECDCGCGLDERRNILVTESPDSEKALLTKIVNKALIRINAHEEVT